MQPAYLPWAGYFNLMASVDIFVFFDDVQYIKREWINRNRILIDGAPHWLSVPVGNAASTQLILDAVVDDGQPWRRRHLNSLTAVYANHPHGREALEPLSEISNTALSRLADLNIRLITALAERMGTKPRLARSSELGCTGKRSARLLNICNRLRCTEYLSPAGAAGYLAEDAVFDNADVRLEFQRFNVKSYPQKDAQQFVTHLSIVDVIANLGFADAARYVRTGSAPSPG